MRRMLSILLLLSLAALACATKPAQRPADMPQPEIDARLVNPLFFGSGAVSPATMEIRVANRGNIALVVRRVELDSPGMGQYAIRRYVRQYNETVPAGQSKVLTAFATAVAQTTTRPTEPLTIRAIVEFQAGDSIWREIVLIRENL
jgi:hypothetical protein